MLFNKTEQVILEEFSKDKDKRVYGRGLAKKFNLNQKTISNILNKLEKKGILKFKQEGKNKYYFLNKNNSGLKDILKLIELNKKIKFVNTNSKLGELFKEIEENMSGILIVFGSYAKEIQKKDSDLDLLVLGKIKDTRKLEDSFGIEINLVNMDKKKFNLEEPFIKEIMENHVVLKGVEEFIDLTW